MFRLSDEMKRLQALVYGSSEIREFKLADHKISNPSDFLLIAEIGNNHNGSLEMAYQLIDEAKQAGAHIAKFQMRHLDSLYGVDTGSQDLSTEYVVNLLGKVSLNNEDMFRCFDYCYKVGVTPLCTPFDAPSLESLESYGMEGYKIASADLTNHQLYRAIIDTKKPIITSTGMSTDEDIDKALNLLELSNSNFAICHANSTYPAPYADVHLNYLHNLKQRTSSVIGYSGHERGWHVPIAAFAMGAQVIEKHFTLDKTMEGNDHKVSLLPDEFTNLYKALSNVAESLGDGHKRFITQGESNNKIALAKSIFCAKNISAGEMISEDHLVVRSPGNGLSPKYYDQLVGNTAMRNIESGEVFYDDDVEGRLNSSLEKYPHQFVWSIPVRHRDVYSLYDKFQPPAIEFHLSFKDLELPDEEILNKSLSAEVIVHSPEQFDNDFIIDLFTEDQEITQKSITLLNKVFEKAQRIGQLINRNQKEIKVIVNCGGHTQKSFLSPVEVSDRIKLFHKNFAELELGNCRFLAQTMPPYPWHFGGQSFHNQFTSGDNIREILSSADERLGLCLDISHSYMWCNYSGESFENFTSSILHKVAHIHISDAAGTSSEGLQIGLGDIDFDKLKECLIDSRDYATLLPEIWQGHENQGSGFRIALNRLSDFGY